MNLRSRTRLNAARLVRLASAFDVAPPAPPAAPPGTPAPTEFKMPDDLTALSDEELAALHDQATALFDQLYGDGTTNVSPADLEVLRGLKAAVDEIEAEQSTRSEASAANNAEAAQLAAAVRKNASLDEDPTVTDLADGSDELASDADEAQAADAVTVPMSTDVVTASAPRAPRRLLVPSNRQATRRAASLAAARPVSPLHAATGRGGFAIGQELDIVGLAELFGHSARGLSRGAAEQANRSGNHFSNRYPVATIHKSFDDRAVVRSDDQSAIEAAIAFVCDEQRLPGGSLVASGGWCSPSETIYDLCELESTEGLFSIPEMGAPRGGIKNTLGPDWSTFFTGTGFCFSETDDINGAYNTNEVQVLTEGGSGLTSFTVTFGGSTSASIAAAATAAAVQAALEAMPTIGVGNVVVTGSASGPYTLTFQGLLANQNLAQVTATPTGGTGTITPSTTTQGGSGTSGKPCITIACPSFVDTRLGVCGICVNAGILMDSSYPELIQRYVRGVIAAHVHRVSYQVLSNIVLNSTAVTFASESATRNSALAPLLSSIELRVEAIKNRYRMARGSSLEAVFPIWVKGLIRADLSRRFGTDNNSISVTDGMIDEWFSSRGINAQFVYNFNGLAASPLVWPSSVSFLLYPAGTWVQLSGDLITLENLHDSSLNANNNYQAIFSEESYAVMRTCHVSEYVTVPVCPSGAAQGGVDFTCPA